MAHPPSRTTGKSFAASTPATTFASVSGCVRHRATAISGTVVPRWFHAPQCPQPGRRSNSASTTRLAARYQRGAIRPAWLVRSRVLQLRERDLISEAQLDAACRFRADYDRAHGMNGGLTSRYDMRVDGVAVSGPELRLALDALRRLREVETALGRTRTRLLVKLIVEDATFRALGAWLDIDHQTAQRRAAEACAALHAHQSGETVPAAIVTRAYRAPGRW